MQDAPQQPVKRSKSSAVAVQGASKLVGLVIQFFFYRLCIEWLGGTTYGTYIFAMSCAAFIGLGDFGLPAATQRYLGEAMAKSDLPRVSAIFRFAWRMHTLLASIAMVGFGIFAFAYDFVSHAKPGDPHAVLLLLCGLQVASLIVISPAMTIAFALDRFREVAFVNFVQGTITPALGIVMLYESHTAESLALSGVIGAVITIFLAYRLCGSRALPPPGHFEKEGRRKLFGLAGRGYPTSITTVIGNNADKVMIHRAGVAESLGSYYLAGRLPETVYQVVFPITTTVYPELTRLAHTDEEAFDRAVERNVRFTLALAASLVIIPSAFSECILRFWLHNSFVDANPGVLFVLPFMAIYRSLELVFGVIAMAFFAKGIPQYGLPFAVFNATVTVFATVPMYRWQGIAGVGLMNAIIDLAQIAPMIFILKRFVAPGVRVAHVAGGFAAVLFVSGVLYMLMHMGVDQQLAHRMPVAGFALAPVGAMVAIATMVRLKICEVPESVGARLKRIPLAPALLGLRA